LQFAQPPNGDPLGHRGQRIAQNSTITDNAIGTVGGQHFAYAAAWQ